MTSGIIDATIAETVGQLLTEASRQFHEYAAMIEKATAAMKAGRHEAGMCLFDEADERLSNVWLLAEDVRQWGLDDDTGIIAMRAEAITEELALTDTEFQQTVEAFIRR
jgi:hypothetical protein